MVDIGIHVCVGSGYNLLSKYAIKMRNKFYLICSLARDIMTEMTLNKGTIWFCHKIPTIYNFLDEYGRKTGLVLRLQFVTIM